MEAPAAIVLRDVTVERGGRRVVQDVTATVRGGRLTGLVPERVRQVHSHARDRRRARALSETVEVLGLAAGTPALRSRVG